MDYLHIKNLEIFAHHGVFPAEKELGQKFVISLELGYDMTRAATELDLEASVHYGILSQQLTDWFQETSEDLIETVAYKLVDRIFSHYPIVQDISLTLKKPWAPVHLPLETCAISLHRKKETVFIGLGSNMGNKVGNLKTAIEHLEKAGLTITKQSIILQTEPWGGVEQEDFANQVLQVETWWTAEKLLETLLTIELEMGRVREVHWGPRIIDLDLLLFGQETHYSDNLILPHPYLAERAFVLESLNEIAPHFIHPILQKPLRQLYQEVTDQP